MIKPMRLLGWDDLRAKGIKDSKPTIYRKIKAGKFPLRSIPGSLPLGPKTKSMLHPEPHCSA